MPNLADAKLYLGATQIGGVGEDDDAWVRPSDWLPMPTVESTEQKFVGLFAVTNDGSGFLSVLARGAYTVDWGDGSSLEDVADNVQANHTYDYSAISNDTLSSRGYKQVIVTITPQSAQTLTVVNVARRPSQYTANRSNAWLEMLLSAPSCTSFIPTTVNTYESTWLERVAILSHNITSFSYRFQRCFSLQSVELENASNVTNMSGMFFDCSSLRTGPDLDTQNVTTVESMFSGCRALRTVPQYNTEKVETFFGMLENCQTLTHLPTFNIKTTGTVSLSRMVSGCALLQFVPLIDTQAATSMNAMFSSCRTLQTVPLFDMGNVTDTQNMFSGCTNLRSLPAFNMSAVTSTSGMFTQGTPNNFLASAPFSGTNADISFLNCALGPAALNAIFTGLADRTDLDSRTITVTGNWGVGQAGYDATIATNKNWVVTE
jgi:hypothetical protein